MFGRRGVYRQFVFNHFRTVQVEKSSSLLQPIDVIENIKAVVYDYQSKVPDGVEFSFTNDNSVYIIRTINILRNNALTGMILIVLVLYIFLGKANAGLASLGIPISFFITFIFMHLSGNTLNGSSTRK